MFDKNIIKKNFSANAHSYDQYAAIQIRSARKLIKRINGADYKSILDVGCGTGNYTHLLNQRFPKARITALDFSAAMIKQAQSKLSSDLMEFMVADAETVNLDRRFDFITSNATFHWFIDLEEVMEKYNNSLKENGLILFSIFGPQTFSELSYSLRKLWGEDVKIASNHFKEPAKVKSILQNNFNNVKIEEEKFTVKYNSLKEIFEVIKYTGTKGQGLSSKRLTPKSMRKLEEIYLANFGEFQVTYEVFFCQGMKR